MINHVRTLLLNIEDLGDRSEELPVGFVPFVYNKQLSEIHNILIPSNLSRFFKRCLAYMYLRHIDAAGLTEDTKLVDKRLTYDFYVDKSEFFQFNRISNYKLVAPSTPKVNDLKIELRIHGQYNSDVQLDNFYRKFKVKQLGSSTTITIEELDSSNNIVAVHQHGTVLTFNGGSNTGYSQELTIGLTGLSISFYSPTNFTTVDSNSSADKHWEFIVETVINADVVGLVDKLDASAEAVDRMLRLSATVDTTKFDNMWKQHFNKVYRLAGLVLAFAYRADHPNNRE